MNLVSHTQNLSKIFFLIIMLASCGRKKKNIFVFNDREEIKKVRKLSFPPIKNLVAKKTPSGVFLSWEPLTKKHSHFCGYALYRLKKNDFIPKTFATKKLLQQAMYRDEKKENEKEIYYFVRGVFKYNEKKHFGPGSTVVSIK